MTVPPATYDDAVAWFVRLQDAAADESEWLAFRDWLEADPRHREAYDAVEALWVDLDEPEPAASNVTPFPSARRSPRRRPVVGWLAAAAASLVVGVAVWPAVAPQIQDMAARTDVYRTPLGQSRDIALADGSRISLNGGSELSVRMESRRRAVTLGEGEAAFDVRHDPARPFVIEAGDRTVRVLGTEFNVLRHDDRLTVTVRRGVVAVNAPAGESVQVGVGEQLVHNAGADASHVRRVNPEDAFAWRRGLVVYQDRPLDEVAADLGRYGGKPVRVLPSAAPLKFTGVLRIEGEAGMLKQLETFLPVQADQNATEILLRARDHR